MVTEASMNPDMVDEQDMIVSRRNSKRGSGRAGTLVRNMVSPAKIPNAIGDIAANMTCHLAFIITPYGNVKGAQVLLYTRLNIYGKAVHA